MQAKRSARDAGRPSRGSLSGPRNRRTEPVELPGEHTALHGFELARVPQRCGTLEANSLCEHSALHGFELARVPQRCGTLEARTVSASTRPCMASSLPASHSGAAPSGERSRRAHGPAWLRACPRPTEGARGSQPALPGAGLCTLVTESIAATRHGEGQRAEDQRRGRKNGHGHGPEREQRRSTGEPHRSRFRAHGSLPSLGYRSLIPRLERSTDPRNPRNPYRSRP